MTEPTDRPELEHGCTQAYFSNAFEILTERLMQAEHQVLSCVDAACPPAWFKLLLACRRRGLEVTLIVPAIELNTQSGLAWERLTAMGGQLVWLEASKASLQTSACVIDQRTVISGNFGDFPSAAKPVFSAIVIQNQPQAVANCWQILRQLQAGPVAVHLPPDALRQPSPNALSTQLIASTDPAAQIAAWQLELLVEHDLAFDAEIADMNRQINDFDSQQNDAIGDLLRQFLDVKQRYLTQVYHQFGGEQRQDQARAAQADYAQFESRENTHAQCPADELRDPLQQEEIKSLYRRLAMLCHPDRVQEQNKLQAQDLFQRVQRSYRNFDLSALKTLAQQLHQTPVGELNAEPDSARKLALRMADLQERLASQYLAHRQILQNPSWRTLSTQSNWSLWFVQQGNFLQAEMQRYSQALEVAAQPAL